MYILTRVVRVNTDCILARRMGVYILERRSERGWCRWLYLGPHSIISKLWFLQDGGRLDSFVVLTEE